MRIQNNQKYGGIHLKLRKAASFAIALTVVTGLLAGCSKGNSANGAVKEEKGETPAAEQAAKDVKLTFFNTSAEVNTVFEELFKKYHEQNPQVTIELIPTPIGGAQLEKFSIPAGLRQSGDNRESGCRHHTSI